jgi:hypothetical protein
MLKYILKHMGEGLLYFQYLSIDLFLWLWYSQSKIDRCSESSSDSKFELIWRSPPLSLLSVAKIW